MILNQATSHKHDGPSAATSRRTAANERRYTSGSTCRSAGRDSDQAALLNLLRRFGPERASYTGMIARVDVTARDWRHCAVRRWSDQRTELEDIPASSQFGGTPSTPRIR
jgi:hypothetical protein